MSDVVALVDFAVKFTQLVGIPVAIVLYGLNKRKERLDREYGTYDELDDKYIEYLKLCLDNTDLDVADTPKGSPQELSPDQRHRERLLFSILIAIFERAYLMYRDKSGAIRDRQWNGWLGYMEDWCQRSNFREGWSILRGQFDSDFLAFMDGVVARAAGEP